MKALPSYKVLKTEFPLRNGDHYFIEQSRQTVRNIVNGTDPRILVITGPCSIHDPESAAEYASLLKTLAHQVSDRFYLVMRVHVEKPRTSFGWKGYLYDPSLDGSNDLKTGIRKTRELLLSLTRMQVPAATEFLDPLTARFFEDLISWGSVGARTSSSQPHRQLASGLTLPIGMKNSLSGNISEAVNAVVSATRPHTFMGLCENGSPVIMETTGNPDAHVVLRGGESGPNYDRCSVAQTLLRLKQNRQSPRILIDCSHQNSEKRADRQPYVFHSVLEQIAEGNKAIRGLLLESHLFSGSQELHSDPSRLRYGISITDDCIDWKSTESLILEGCRFLSLNTNIGLNAYALAQ